LAVSTERGARVVYSTGAGRVCPVCGWSQRDCKCSNQRAASEPVPAKVVAKLRVEKAGRGGKTVTVVYDLPKNEGFLKALCQDLKKACGTGGTTGHGTVEIQGEHRERLREVLQARGCAVKG
jgi:translation initiation factor 1